MTNLKVYHCQNESNVELKCFGNDTLWATQEQMGLIFGTTKQSISYHLDNKFTIQELDKNSVVRFYRTTALDGKI
jgi:hypothetical protein